MTGGDLTNVVSGPVPELAKAIKGISEETTTGVLRLYERMKKGTPPCAGYQRERFGHQVQIRQ